MSSYSTPIGHEAPMFGDAPARYREPRSKTSAAHFDDGKVMGSVITTVSRCVFTKFPFKRIDLRRPTMQSRPATFVSTAKDRSVRKSWKEGARHLITVIDETCKSTTLIQVWNFPQCRLKRVWYFGEA
jgi:hypothetical protein